MIGSTEHATPLSTIFQMYSTGRWCVGPEMPQWVMMSTPASTAMLKLSTEVVWVWTVMPARRPSSTIARWTAGENDTKFIST